MWWMKSGGMAGRSRHSLLMAVTLGMSAVGVASTIDQSADALKRANQLLRQMHSNTLTPPTALSLSSCSSTSDCMTVGVSAHALPNESNRSSNSVSFSSSSWHQISGDSSDRFESQPNVRGSASRNGGWTESNSNANANSASCLPYPAFPTSHPFHLSNVPASLLEHVNAPFSSVEPVTNFYWRHEKDMTVIHPIHFVHRYPLHQVYQAFFTKFPSAANPEVLNQPIVSEIHDPHKGTVTRRRLILIENSMPWIFKRLLQQDVVVFEEESVYDYKNGTFIADSRNRSFSWLGIACEHSKFSVRPFTDEQRIVYDHYQAKQSASGSSAGVPSLPVTFFEQYGGVQIWSSWLGPLKKSFESLLIRRVDDGGKSACQILEQQLQNQSKTQTKQHNR